MTTSMGERLMIRDVRLTRGWALRSRMWKTMSIFRKKTLAEKVWIVTEI